MLESFVSDGGVEIGAGPACFTDAEVKRQRTALQNIADQVEMYRQVQNHVDALLDLADNLAAAAEQMRTADVKIAVGAYPEDVSQIESDVSDSVFTLEAGVRAYADALASKYGIDIA